MRLGRHIRRIRYAGSCILKGCSVDGKRFIAKKQIHWRWFMGRAASWGGGIGSYRRIRAVMVQAREAMEIQKAGVKMVLPLMVDSRLALLLGVT